MPNTQQSGTIIPVVITVYQDRSFTFITKSPPAPVLIKKAAGFSFWITEARKRICWQSLRGATLGNR